MTYRENIRIALRALSANSLRSGLTMLGIIIGVAAVITMMAVGAGAQSQVLEQIRTLGANLLLLRSGSTTLKGARLGSGSLPSLTMDDAVAIGREIPSVLVSVPLIYARLQAVHGNRNWKTVIQGITPDYLVAREWKVTEGRSLTTNDVDRVAKVALVGRTVMDKLFKGTDPIGRIIRVNTVPFTVVGVLQKKGRSILGRDQDDKVIIPVTTAKIRILGAGRSTFRWVHYIMVKVSHAGFMEDAERQIRSLLRQRHRTAPDEADDFTVRNLAEVQAQEKEASDVLTRLLVAVALVSLVVGGISIMNIMLVSVTERTREIGLRLAVGARPVDVRNQFLVEAVALTLVGGTVGTVLGIVVSVVIARIAGWPILIQVDAIAISVIFAAGIGIFFGFYPAYRASLLDPSVALRSE